MLKNPNDKSLLRRSSAYAIASAKAADYEG